MSTSEWQVVNPAGGVFTPTPSSLDSDSQAATAAWKVVAPGTRPPQPPQQQAPDTSQWQVVQHKATTPPKPNPASYPTPAQPNGKPGIYRYNTNNVDVNADFAQDWSQGKGGVRPVFRDTFNQFVQQGWNVGVFDFNQGHGDPNHIGPTDPHLQGRAADIDVVNGETISGKATPLSLGLARSWLARSPYARVGVGGDLYSALHAEYGDRVFKDEPTHMHVELSPQAIPGTSLGAVATGGSGAPPSKTQAAGGLGSATGATRGQFFGKLETAGGLGDRNHNIVTSFQHGMAAVSHNINENVNYYQNHPYELVDAVLGSAQRFVAGQAASAIQHAQTPATGNPMMAAAKASVEEMGSGFQNAFSSFDPKHRQMQAQAMQTILDGVHAPKLKGWGQAGEMLLAQTITDPLTYVDGIGALFKLAKGHEVASIFTEAMSKMVKETPVAQQFVGHFQNMAQSKYLQWAHDFYTNVFTARPELNDFLDAHAKAARMAIEQKWASKLAKPGLTDAEKDAQKALFERQVNMETQSYLQRYGGWKGAVDPKKAGFDVGKLSFQNTPLPFNLSSKYNPMNWISSAGKSGILGDPFPHGLNNVGQLAYLKAGPLGFAKAMGYAIKGLTKEQTDRLVNMGAHSEYMTDLQGVYARIWGLKLGVSKAQGILNRLEGGYRQALLDDLDRNVGKFGPLNPSNLQSEFGKAKEINEALGDYRNVSKFVQALHALGGPFVAFRMGVVPKALLNAIMENPGRVERQVRIVNDTNNAVLGPKGQTFHLGGPTEDFGRMVSNPVAYAQSTASLGPLGTLLQFYEGQHDGKPQNLGATAENLATYYGPPGLGTVVSAFGIPYPSQGHKPGEFDLKGFLLRFFLGSYVSDKSREDKATSEFNRKVEHQQ